jgi:hypothetical protein
MRDWVERPYPVCLGLRGWISLLVCDGVSALWGALANHCRMFMRSRRSTRRLGRTRGVEQLILGDSEHGFDRIYGSGYEYLAMGVDHHPGSLRKSRDLAEAASSKIGGLYKPARAFGQANAYILRSSLRIRAKSAAGVYLAPPWLLQQSIP